MVGRLAFCSYEQKPFHAIGLVCVLLLDEMWQWRGKIDPLLIDGMEIAVRGTVVSIELTR